MLLVEDGRTGPTIKTVQKSHLDEEDEEEGWEEMAKKKKEKKNRWRSKKDGNGLKEMLGYTP